MIITNSDITTYRMQICTSCKNTGDNILHGDEICHGYNDEIEYCINTNAESWMWIYGK